MQLEVGGDDVHHVSFPASGLAGNLWRAPLLNMQIGLSSIAELQFTGGLHDQLAITSRQPAPLSAAIVRPGNTTTDFDDLIVSTMVRLTSEHPAKGHPVLAVAFGTELPNAKPYSGMGLSTTNFRASGIGALDVGRSRLIVNLGLGILGDPVAPHHHQNAIEYGLAVTRRLTTRWQLAADLNGRLDAGSLPPPAGTESRGSVRFGVRCTLWRGWLGAAVIRGLTAGSGGLGIAGSYTVAFHLLRVH